jgi:ribosomal-protein-alanine N-acetyltransferase
MISIDTKRLHLRNVSQNDAHVIFDYRNNEICARYQRWQAKDFEKILNLIERRKMMKLGYKDLGYVSSMDFQAFGKWTTSVIQ